MTVASPCRNICALDPDSRICLGCGRTLVEIGMWSRMTDAEKQAVLDRLATLPSPAHSNNGTLQGQR